MASVAQGTCNPIDPAIKLFGRTIEKLYPEELPCTFSDFKSNGDLQIDLDFIRSDDGREEPPGTPSEIHPDFKKLDETERNASGGNMHSEEASENEEADQMHQNGETEGAVDNSLELPNEEQCHGNDGAKEHKSSALEKGIQNHNEEKIGKSAVKKPEKPVPCPRCQSLDTKFCYFNNYNVNQPRHFCKHCQRYWTAGGSLRNVPVGAGRRKNKSSSSNSNMNMAGQLTRRQLTDVVVGVRGEPPDSAQQVLTMASLNNHLNIGHAKNFMSATEMPKDVKNPLPSSTVLSFVQDGIFRESMLLNKQEGFQLNVMARLDTNGVAAKNKPPNPRNGEEPMTEHDLPELNLPNASSFNTGSTMIMTNLAPSQALGPAPSPNPFNTTLSMSEPMANGGVGQDGQLHGWAAGPMFPYIGGPWQYPGNTSWAVPPPLTTSTSNASPQCINPNQSLPPGATNQSPWPGSIGSFWPGFPWPLMWPPPGSWTIPWTPVAAAAAATAINAAAAAAAATAATNDHASRKREREHDQQSIVDCERQASPSKVKLLRIGDPGEAIRSSILEVLGVDKKLDSVTSGGIFGASQHKCGSHESDSDWLQSRFSNLAALVRSFTFQERATQN